MSFHSLQTLFFLFFIHQSISASAGNLLSCHKRVEVAAGLNTDSLSGSTCTQRQVFGFGGPYLIANLVIIVITLLNIIVYELLELQDKNFDSDQKSSSSVILNLSSEKQLSRCFSLDEIVLATKNFDELLVIGKGGFGKVYKGIIDNGSSTVAIKRLNPLSKQGSSEFWTEIKMLSKFRHSHLVSLIGYCDQNNEMILVYEFMIHGSLDNHLHKISKNDKSIILSWVQRLKICIGAARGLDYLHTGTALVERVIHRDVKSSNILLNENWAAKISDFGLSRIGPADQESTHVSTTHVQGTYGYMDPEYFYTRRFTRKTDVYAFGVVLLEVLSERAAVDRSLPDEDQWSLAVWGQHCINEGTPHKLVGPNVNWEILPNSLTEFVEIAGQCLHSRPKTRPTMSEVVAKLELALSWQLRTNELMDDDLLITDWPFGSLEDTIPPVNSNQIVQVGDSSSKHPFQPEVQVVSGDSGEKPSSNDNTGYNNNSANKVGRAIYDMMPTTTGQIKTPNLKKFKLFELELATDFFKLDVLGEGSFGRVYKGWVDKKTLGPTQAGYGKPVAIKRWNRESVWGPEEGLVEVRIWEKFSHFNLVNLLGYYHGENNHEFLLVYEYMQNGSLDNYLFGKFAEPLSWYRRLKIAIGTARALSFLHEKRDDNIIIHDLQTSCILLDEDFNAKLSGFGFSEQNPQCFETMFLHKRAHKSVCAAPQYVVNGDYRLKSNVYSFGVVLLELLTGLRAIDLFRRQPPMRNLVEWARPFLSNERSVKMELVDPRLANNYPPKGAIKLALLIRKCLESKSQDRPSMKEVLLSLEQNYLIKPESREAQEDTSKSLWPWTRNLRKTSSQNIVYCEIA